MIKRRFKNFRSNQTAELWFDAATGKVLLGDKWWDVVVLKQTFGIAEDPEVIPLGDPTTPKFAAGVEKPIAFQNKFSFRSRQKKKWR